MMNRMALAPWVAVLLAGTLSAQDGTGAVTVGGELKRWHKVTLTLDGPGASETGTPNPFLDYAMKVTFTNGSLTFVVPGYFAADGNAANTSATSGTKWRAHLCPDLTGTWTYSISFTSGANVAVNGGGTAVSPYNGKTGTFTVAETDKTGRDHRGKGRLQYVGKHHLRFKGNGEYFLKQGADAPENLLAYQDFDGPFKTDGQKDDLIKTWSPHAGDWKAGDPTWKSGLGKGLIGAVNYLASEGMNVFSFLTMNINGDDKNVFPYLDYSERTRMDVSRLDQWEIVFEHGDRMGMYLHFKTQETENDQLLDGGDLGTQRKLYYRELVARFAHHLALNWNLGEENTNTDAQRKAFADYFKQVDPYDHPVVIHTFPGDKDAVYTPLLGHATLDGASLQSDPGSVFNDTKKWVDQSANAGHPWVVANDEQGSANAGVVPDADDYWHDTIRKDVLWGNAMAGGAGCEYYFGYSYADSDLTCQDFRSRDHWWDLARFCLQFFKDNQVPFWDMKNDNALSSSGSDYCLYKAGEAYVIYLKSGGTTSLDLSAVSGTYSVRWFDPRNGGSLQTGPVSSVSGGGSRSLGNAPSSTSSDWAILVKRTDTPSTPPAAPSNLAASAASSSQINLSWTDNASNEDGFKIERKTGSGGTWAQVATVGAGVTTYSNTGLSASTTYYYRVRATNAAGDSSWSNEASSATPAAPAGQAVSSFTLVNADTDADIGPLANGATLNLATLPTRNLNVRANTSPAAVGSVKFGYDGNASYRIESTAPYALEGDTSGNYNAWTPAVGSHTLVATPYTESAGAGTAGTPLTVSFTVTDQAPSPPAAPSGLAASAASSSQINLSWTDNSSDETGFKIERKTGSGGTWAQVATVGAGVTTYSNTGLSASTTYYFRVRAYNANGDSAYSNEAGATTSAPAPTVPAAPSGLAASAASSSQISLSWTDNSTDETGFKIERKTGSGGTWAQVVTVGAGETTYSNTGLSDSTTYYYRVRATNAAGDSSWSNEASATTPAPTEGPGLKGEYYDNADFTAPALARTDAQVNFNWGTGSPDPSMGADTFSVRWTGRVQAEYTEVYTFFVNTDDGVRLWVNGELLVDRWQNQAPTEASESLALRAGVSYTIQMDYYENTGGAVAQLLWESASTPKGLIPQDRLDPATGPADARDNDGDGTANDQDADDDGDGVPDLQDSDRDGDGVANLVEEAAGTDPDDRTSFPGAGAGGGDDDGRCGLLGLEILVPVGLLFIARRRRERRGRA
jgi:transcriptional regulator CtsR